jgi:hypothetical protein
MCLVPLLGYTVDLLMSWSLANSESLTRVRERSPSIANASMVQKQEECRRGS